MIYQQPQMDIITMIAGLACALSYELPRPDGLVNIVSFGVAEYIKGAKRLDGGKYEYNGVVFKSKRAMFEHVFTNIYP